MRRTIWLLGLALFPALLGGCYGAQLMRQPVTVEESARDLEAMRQQQAAVEARLVELEKRSSEQAELMRGLRAETTARYGEVESRLATIDSRLRDVLGQRDSGSRPGASYWNATPGPAKPVESPAVVTPPPASPSSPGDAALGGAGAQPPAGADAPGAVSGGVVASLFNGGADSSGTAPLPEADGKRLYDQAYKDLTRGNYSLAVLGFRGFLQRSPASDLADNAQYWVGECFYAQRDYNQAIQEFLKVQESYPGGDKVPAALLKTGYSFLQLEDRASARRYLNQVVEQFPNSEEATTARNKLRSAF